MDITPLIDPDSKVIQSYGSGVFRISNQQYRTPVLVTVRTVTEWKIGAETPTQADLAGLIPFLQDVDVLLVGTGNATQFIPPAIRQSLKPLGITIDVMDTGAACRTYAVLMAEGRRVAAALIPLR